MNRKPPKISLSRLRGLQGRELFLRLFWGAGRFIAVVLFALAIACLTDYTIDRTRETPYWLRVLLTGAQTLLALTIAYLVIWRPWRKLPTLDVFAADVEAKIPSFGHRLVSAIQLNRPDAETKGMSPSLIDDLTHEAEEIAERENFKKLADHRRLPWAVMLALPFIAMAGILYMLNPAIVSALVQRQALLDVEIPRDLSLVSDTKPIWPSGEPATIRIEATSKSGKIDPSLVGEVRVDPEGLPSDHYELKFVEEIAPGKAIFAVEVPKSSVKLSFRGWIGDGRMRKSEEIQFVPRPIVTRIDAWVRLPEFVGKRTDGSLYEDNQPQGEINGFNGGTARVRLEASKDIQSATLVLYGRPDNSELEVPLQRISMSLEGNRIANSVFTVNRKVSAYRLEVVDEFGFVNHNPPRRNVAVLPDEAPYVTLLPEQFPGDDLDATDADVEGIPIPLGKTIRIGYYSRSPLGLAKSRLVYRVNEGNWLALPLAQVTATAEVGPFDPRRGVFDKTGFLDQIEFYPMPSGDRSYRPDGLEGGGRFDFQTKGLRKTLPDGKTSELEIGDRVEFAVEVYDRDPTFGRAPGRSDARLKAIVDLKGFYAWMDTVVQNEQKLRKLRDKQQAVFEQNQ